jgi:imidazolonepropionase-like amidohydrolase
VLAGGTVPGAPELTEAQMRAAVEEASWYGRHVAAHAHGAEGIKRAIRAGVRSIEHACFLDDEGIELMLEHGTYLSSDIWWADWIREIGPSQGYDAEQLRKNDETAEAQRVAFAKAVRAGVRIGFGTDAGGFPHGMQGRQLATMVEYGMTPPEAVRAATLTSAECMGWEDRVGSIEPGRYADLVAIPGALDIRKFADVAFVMKGGTVVKNELP